MNKLKPKNVLVQYLKDPDAIKKLSELFAKVKFLTEYKSKDDPETWKLAYSLSEIEESLVRILQEHLPRLASMDHLGEKESDAVFDHLHAIREECRHIVYHINDSEFLKTGIQPDEIRGRD